MNTPEGLHPFIEAEKQIPIHWYEKGALFSNAGCVAFGVGYIALYDSYAPQYQSLLPNIISGCLSIGAVLMDFYSTLHTFKVHDEFVGQGYEPVIHESSPFLAGAKTAKEFIKHPMLYVTGLMSIGASTLYPSVGFPLTAYRLVAAMNNMRIARRLELATGIAKTLK